MTKRIYLPVILLMIIATVGCKKYVDKGLPDTFDDNNFWRTEDNVRVYSWPFYEMFLGFGNGNSFGDFYFTSLSDDQAAPSLQPLTLNIPASNGKWDFSYIRKANILLERVDRVQMDDAAKNHWKGVARFFRALSYFNLVKEFGDVPWLGHSMDITDTSYIYKPRDPRTLVMDSVLKDLDFAVANLRVADQENTINQYVALALKSRVCLFEGTWRKYHIKEALPDADKFLLAAKDAAEKLITSSPFTLNEVYTTTYGSLDLSKNQEVMLCKKYVAGYLGHSVIGYLTSSTPMSGFTKNAIESFVCTDGLPIKLSPLYKGDDTIKNTLANRDKRMLWSVDTVLCHAADAVQGRQSSTGYRPTKFLNPAVANIVAPGNDTDAPLFWLAEVLLNYAEAAVELSNLKKYSLSQADLDKSVNKLRKRAGIAPLQYVDDQHVAVNGVTFDDPANNHGVSSLTWEIRRERRVELMLDGFRYYDLLRWLQGDKLSTTTNPDITKGAMVRYVDPKKKLDRDANNYIQLYTNGVTRVFAEKNYLQPIPSAQIALYPPQQLSQNPGW